MIKKIYLNGKHLSDLLFSEYLLFLKLKLQLKGQRFEDISKIGITLIKLKIFR